MRFYAGKELLDRGALRAVAECNDNDRHEVLERFRDYVLPHYDDLQSVYPEIKLVESVFLPAVEEMCTPYREVKASISCSWHSGWRPKPEPAPPACPRGRCRIP